MRTTPVLIHISDTPDHIYKYIFQIISSVRPEFVVHTGDVVDNTKLESQEHLSGEYSRIVSSFINKLETITNGTVVLTPGNHDNIGLMKHYSNSIGKKGFYNGYNHINFILPEEEMIFTMKYPLGISEMRGINRPLFRGI
ncbi:MAG: metallophosphoesterase [Spirochaetes bacterium]|nr:metallophosphoesterase [Spirochaetota bacterium]